MAYVVDADGERKHIRVIGWDGTEPSNVYEGWIEVRRGGMMVFHAVDNRAITVSAPPAVPTHEEIKAATDQRAAEYMEKEQAAAAQERQAASKKQAELEEKREARRRARETAETTSESPSAA